MSSFVIPVGFDDECCSCERAVDACTCCPFSVGMVEFSQFSGFNCGSGPPCGSGPAECGGATIGPVTLYSDENFKKKCLEKFDLKAQVYLSVDNGGYAEGEETLTCPVNNSSCVFCTTSGIIEPYMESVNETESRAYIKAFAQNAPHGGGYALVVSAYFYLYAKE